MSIKSLFESHFPSKTKQSIQIYKPYSHVQPMHPFPQLNQAIHADLQTIPSNPFRFTNPTIVQQTHPVHTMQKCGDSAPVSNTKQPIEIYTT